ncbi:MAG: glycosyltransferase [Prevotella sp.]|jgi:glycosyltransferase involved in cell wall biosynthesis|nr:glycosyltransferase [Prevotella sp.]MCI1685154.1 glycosyltransferase [Prevotella sp.]MCI1816375.1 glycosyltransferase [Prevotella sp.]MCI2179374.1 glycosyltransferase [Prevotella sp.]
MRILHISKYYYPYIGGVENICRYLVENMPQYDIAVVCFSTEHKDVIEDVHGIRVYRVATWINISRQALSLSYFTMLHRALKEFKPDVIHFHWANPFPAAVLLTMFPENVKLVIHWHMDIIKQSKIYPVIKPVETALLKRADLVLVTSPQYRDASVPLQPFRNKVKILPNAIDEDHFILRDGDLEKINTIRDRFNHKPIVFFVGRHIQYKGLPHLLEAEKQVKSDCVFIIAGSGPLTEELQNHCTSSRVHFVGRLSDEDLKLYHYAASVFAFPSITKNEAFGVALAEAMYCGTPTVTFTIPGSGVNWVSLNGETGLEVPNGDDKAFANAIDKLLNDKVISKKFAENGMKRVKENFTIPVMVTKMDKYYHELDSKNLNHLSL